jgi:hypothetical protein
VNANGVGGVNIQALAVDQGFVTNGSIVAPAATSMDLRAISFEAKSRGEDTAILACFTAPLPHGFAREEVAPLALDALRDTGIRKLGLRDIANGPIGDLGPVIRRIDSGRSSGGANATIVSDLGFTRDGDLVACVTGCSNDAACGQAVRATRMVGELQPPPAPGLALSLLLGVVHHPEASAAWAVGAALALSVLAVHFRRRPRRFFV